MWDRGRAQRRRGIIFQVELGIFPRSWDLEKDGACHQPHCSEQTGWWEEGRGPERSCRGQKRSGK